MAHALVSVIVEQLALAEQELGFKEEVQRLTDKLNNIDAVLEDAERSQFKDPTAKRRLNKLKDVFYDLEKRLDEWNTADLKMQIEGEEIAPKLKRKVCYFIPSSCFCYRQVDLRRDIAIVIKKLNKTLDVISVENDSYKSNLARNNEELERRRIARVIDLSMVHGRDKDKKTIVDKLLSDSSQGPTPCTISIVGMEGIGKTTLAQLVYNDVVVTAHFQVRIWVCVSDPFDELRIAKAILEALYGRDPGSNQLATVLEHIHQFIKGRKFLLVLDDVCNEDSIKWEPLKNSLYGSPGSRILVTTRKDNVAKVMGTDMFRLEQLSNEECWSLFSQVAFFERSREECKNLEDIGRRIVKMCKGLPLAAKVLGSLLCFKNTREEWQSVLDSEVWKLEEASLFPPLVLSYFDLSPTLRQCFSYCTIFPKGYDIEKDRLIKLWMAQGYLRTTGNTDLEMVGEECFEKLAMRSFFQDFEKNSFGTIITCKMHNIVYEFAQFLTEREYFVMDIALRLNARQVKARHSMFRIEGGGSIFAPVKYAKNLRSLVVEYKSLPLTGAIAFEALDEFTCLRTLDFSGCKNYGCSLKKLPNGIGKLIHLRYLNLAYNYALTELPETVCDLCNLQSLTVTHCMGLKNLPRGLGKLIKLRHLEIVSSGISFLPKGFERLTSLRYLNLAYNNELKELAAVCDLYNLQSLNVTHCEGLENLPYGLGKLIKLRHLEIVSSGINLLPRGLERLTCLETLDALYMSDNSEAFNIGDLKNLNHLRYLKILELGKVRDVEEVKRAQLENKKHLITLVIDFSREGLIGGSNKVIEAIQPPPNLEELTILKYEGYVLPNWITSLSKLRKVQVSLCWNSQLLPPLGKLPCLVSLEIWDLPRIKRVGIEFLGIKTKNESETTTSSLSVIAFPELKQLHFHGLYRWEKWDYGTTTSTVTIMPRLHSLIIKDCPKLKALPDHILQSTSLKQLEISREYWGRNLLQQRYYYYGRKGEDWPEIAHIPNIKIDDKYVQKHGVLVSSQQRWWEHIHW